MAKDNIRTVTLNVDIDLHKRWKMKCLDKGVTMSDTLDAFLKIYTRDTEKTTNTSIELDGEQG